MNTREQMADMLWRLATDNGWDVDVDALKVALVPYPEEEDEEEDD